MSNSNPLASILIADRQFLIVEGLKNVLKNQFSVDTTAGNGDELWEALRMICYRILILDIEIFDCEFAAKISQIRQLYPNLGIIVISHLIGRKELIELNSLGIKHILHKNVDKEEFFDCLEAFKKKKKYYSGAILDMIFEMTNKKESFAESTLLTSSELEIVKLIGEGLTNKEIAQRKYLSIHTIATHRKNIFRKLNLSSASELVMFAIKNGLIDNVEYQI